MSGAVAASPRVVELARELASLKAHRRDVDIAIQDCEVQVIDAMDGAWECVVPGLGAVKRRKGTKRTAWQHDDLWRLMGRMAQERRNVDEDTGEVESVADALARHITAACAPGYWRTTPLREWGVDPDEYCQKTEGRDSIQIVGVD